MKRTGGCACGAVRFEAAEPFFAVGSCHCTDCQKISGGGPNYVALVPKAALTVTKGEPKLHEKAGDSGKTVKRAFCGECGTPLWSLPPEGPFFPVKLGAFDDAAGLAPQMQIYTSSAPAWHRLDMSLPSFEKMPPAPA